jgi:hypothetical protein
MNATVRTRDGGTPGKRSWRRAIFAIAASLCGFAALVIGATILAYPAAAAGACPTCYGFERLAPRIYLQAGVAAEEKARINEVIAEARERVRNFYGSLQADPDILICETDPCYRRFGGGSRGQTIMDAVIFLSPRGTDPVIASHEMSHTQIHNRIGFFHSLIGDVPEWFVEGVAVVVSDDRRYLASVGAADRCLVEPDGPLPAHLADWIRNAGPQQLYAKSACEVTRWMTLRGGSPAIVKLLRDVAGGMTFEAAWSQS